jgi:hypothetical protein
MTNERSRRPRISILTALLLLTIAGLTVTVWRQSFEAEPLRREVRRLRQELGHLTIDDESKIYAIQVPSANLDTKRFRVYLPKNRKFVLCSRIHTIPGKKAGQSRKEWFATLGGSGSASTIDSGEFTIDVFVKRSDEDPDHWNLHNSINGRGGGTVGSKMPWLNDRRAWTTGADVGLDKQTERDADEGLVLFELRQGTVKEFPGGYSVTPADETKDQPGVMMWIEAAP